MTTSRLMRAAAVAVAAALAVTFIPAGAASAAKGGGTGYVRYFSGNAADVQPAFAGGLLLAGGGTDSDAAMRWLLGRGGNGDVVVLDAYGDDSYAAYLIGLGADSVETFVFSSLDGANKPEVVAAVQKAEVIWIDGGDQSNYVKYWQGTALQTAVNARVAAGAAFGGTSAGLAVLGGWVYSALYGSATSAAVLANPYDKNVTLRSALFTVPVLANTITDTHFQTRDRMGRLVGFLARLEKDLRAVRPRAIAVDEGSAVAVDPSTGAAQVFGEGGGAWFLRTDQVNGRLVVAKKPLTYAPVDVRHVRPSGTFNLTSWTGGDAYTVSANTGVLTATPPGTPY